MKVLVVIGTRPEAIKMIPVYKALQARKDISSALCITAQHRHMLDQVLSTFQIKPDFDLNLMSSNQDLFDITRSALAGMKEVLDSYQPDWVLVQGDTSTTFTASLAAFYKKISVGHVEAGLRTGRKFEPWPEEINRKMTTVLADLHFAPTTFSKANLLREAVPEDRIFITGNTVIDSLKNALEMIEQKKELKQAFEEQFKFLNPARKLILVTAHRRENFGASFEDICTSLKTIVETHADVELLFPVHPNPNVREPVYRILHEGGSRARERIHLIEPLDYLPFVYLIKKSYLIISDSGGLQEEASWLGKPLLIMRDTTERPEVLTSGGARLVGTNPEKIQAETHRLLSDQAAYAAMLGGQNVFGDGTASLQIVDKLLAFKK